MSTRRRCNIVEVTQQSLTTQESPPCPTDWTKCVICQKDNPSDSLLCPANKNDGAGYKTLTENLLSFSNLGCLPFDIVRLDEGGGVVESLRQKKARVHKECKLNFSKSRLKRAGKRKGTEEDDGGREKCSKYTRQSDCSIASTSKSRCFFCSGATSISDPLHEACTFGMDAYVRKCAFQ